MKYWTCKKHPDQILFRDDDTEDGPNVKGFGVLPILKEPPRRCPKCLDGYYYRHECDETEE